MEAKQISLEEYAIVVSQCQFCHHYNENEHRCMFQAEENFLAGCSEFWDFRTGDNDIG